MTVRWSRRKLVAVILSVMILFTLVNAIWIEEPAWLPAKVVACFNVACAAVLVGCIAVLIADFAFILRLPIRLPRAKEILGFCTSAVLYNLALIYVFKMPAHWGELLAMNALLIYAWFVARRWAARRKLPG